MVLFLILGVSLLFSSIIISALIAMRKLLIIGDKKIIHGDPNIDI